MDISKIRPNNVKKSDKYSKNIYEYVFHHLRMNEVFYIMDDADTSLTPFDLQESLKYFQPKMSKQILIEKVILLYGQIHGVATKQLLISRNYFGRSI